MAQFLQRELFNKKDERLEQLHFDARYRLAQTQLQWGEALSDEEKATEQLRRAQASVAGFQRISPRWPDEEYARYNQLYRDILAALGSPQVDLPRDLDGEPVKVDPVDDDLAGNQANPNPETPEPEESGGSNVFLMIVMLVFGGGAVAGLYFLAVGGNKKKYAKYETDGERPAPPPATDDKLTFPVEVPAAPEKKKEVQMPAFELNLSDGSPAKGATATADEKKLAQKKAMTRKKAAQQKGAAKASGQKKAAQPSSAKQTASSGEKPKRKYTEEEIKKIKAARAAKAKAAKKKAEGAEKPKKKPEDS